MRSIPESRVVAEEKEEDSGEVDRGAHDALVFFLRRGGSVIAHCLVYVVAVHGAEELHHQAGGFQRSLFFLPVSGGFVVGEESELFDVLVNLL